MANKYLFEIESTETMSDNDKILIVVNTKEYLITKANFVKVLGGLDSDDYAKIDRLVIDGNGTGLLSNNGTYKSIANLFNREQVTINTTTGLAEIAGYHTHDNKTILDKLTVDSETGKLLYDGVEIASEYELSIATTEILGGVKPDGTTITIDDNGVISGASTYELPTASDTVLGGVKVDNDTIKINDGVISADVIGNWSAGSSYPVGYFIIYDNALYQCITANSDTEWTENNWSLIGSNTSGTGMTINNWTANTEYAVGNLVINETTIYQCNTAHTSGEMFDETNWTSMTGAKGDKGEDGFSPIANVIATETGATITITDATETTTVDITNGTTPHIDETTKHWFVGEEDTGIVAEGVNGISPIASIEQTETGAIVTVVSGEETTTANLTNGTTPHIDETTKHWIVNGEDTGVTAEGTTTVTTSAVVYNETLLAENWIGDTVPYTQTVTIEGIDETSRPYLYPVLSDDVVTGLTEQKEWGYITKAVTSTDSITFSCYKTKPTVDINFEAEVR